jgi:alanine racemase
VTDVCRAAAVVDLSAIRANLSRIRELAGDAQVMAVVKADAYGHGMVEVARTARGHGVEWLGVALPSEALALRAAGDRGRILMWLWTPGDPDVAECIAMGVDVSVSGRWALDEVARHALAQGRPARVQVKLDTGLSRNGVPLARWPDLLAGVEAAVAAGLIELTGIWSHLADGDLPGSRTVAAQLDSYVSAVTVARDRGVGPGLMHVSNSGGLFAHPECRFDLVRVGIAMYGLTPASNLGRAADLGLVPAMTLRARLANVKRVPAGSSVSYGGHWTTPVETTLGLVPLGYADGVPRSGGDRVQVVVSGHRYPAVGRIAMDQFVIDLGSDAPKVGDEVLLFGPGTHGEATADEWAERIDTIGYEIVARIGARVTRVYTGGSGPAGEDDETP